jgi:hypothetical protein
MMINKQLTLGILPVILAASCSPAEERASGTVENRSDSGQYEFTDLPRLSRPGIEYPYIRYAESTGHAESRGQIFWLFPTTGRRNQLVAVEHEPGSRVEGLVVEEVLGSAGEVVTDGRSIKIDFMPISLPHDVAAGQEWDMRYANRDFTCMSSAVSGGGAGSDRLEVSCSEDRYQLHFSFERERGVTEYQDFCGHSICTFRLDDPIGLLSRATLEHMGLPKI